MYVGIPWIHYATTTEGEGGGGASTLAFLSSRSVALGGSGHGRAECGSKCLVALFSLVVYVDDHSSHHTAHYKTRNTEDGKPGVFVQVNELAMNIGQKQWQVEEILAKTMFPPEL